MDREVQALVRSVQRAGPDAVLALAIELINGMSDANHQHIQGLVTFYTQRKTRTWNLAGHIFKLSELPDSTITRLINESQCVKHWRNYLKYGRRAYGYDWAGGEREQHVYEVILDEAEHRGLLSGLQKVWKKLRDKPTAKLLTTHYREGRCKHDYIAVDEDFTCIKCRRKVVRTELTEYADQMLRGRLRSRVC